MRSGRHSIVDAPFEGVLPYLAWQAQIGSKLLLGIEALSLGVCINKKAFRFMLNKPLLVLNVSAALQGIAFALEGCEKGNLISIEDEITKLILDSDGDDDIDIQSQVNKLFLIAYDGYLDDWRLAKENILESVTSMEIGLDG
jgi:hypothetical protein